MKSSILISAVAAAVIGAPAVFAADYSAPAPAATPQASTSATYVKDSPITTAVKSRLKEADVSSYNSLSVDTDANGEVWLKGMVDTQADADRAIGLAKSTANVKAVHSDIEVKATK